MTSIAGALFIICLSFFSFGLRLFILFALGVIIATLARQKFLLASL
jgi:hypothetical protein